MQWSPSPKSYGNRVTLFQENVCLANKDGRGTFQNSASNFRESSHTYTMIHKGINPSG